MKVMGNCDMQLILAIWNNISPNYSFSHNHGSGKWLYLKGNYYWRDPFLTSMITGGSVDFLGIRGFPETKKRGPFGGPKLA